MAREKLSERGYIIYIGNPGSSLCVRTATGLREANRIAKQGSIDGGHARVDYQYRTVSEWHLGDKEELPDAAR